MITIAASIGFVIVAICTTVFFLDFAMLNLGKQPIFGLPREGVAKWVAGWLLAGGFLLMLTFPYLISEYHRCQLERDSRGIAIDAPRPAETTNKDE